MRKRSSGFPTWSDTNQAVQLQKMARGLKFRIKKVEGLYYLCSETKAMISFRVNPKLICIFVLAYAKCWFSHDAAHFCPFSMKKLVVGNFYEFLQLTFEPRREKTGILGFRPGLTQTRLYSYRRWLVA